MESIHRHSGGKELKRKNVPTEREGMALTVGAAMLWVKLRDSSAPAFFRTISDLVKHCEGTDRDFDRDDMVWFVQERVFGGIPQYAVETWVQRGSVDA